MPKVLLIASAVLLAAACSSGAGPSASRTADGASPDTTMVSSTSVVLATAAARTTVKCADQIGWSRNPLPSYSVVLGKTALPTKRAFGASRLHPNNPNSLYFAKQGLLIKPGAKFELIVPPAWTSRMTIGWGNPGKETGHLGITGCRSQKAGAHWIAFAGGFTINKPACVPLIVKSGTEQGTVKIGVGKACAGQAPPPK